MKKMTTDEILKKIKELKQKENDLYIQRSGLSSAYAGASYREQDSFDRLYEVMDEKIQKVRDEIEELKSKL